jgi:hypothetical protein
MRKAEKRELCKNEKGEKKGRKQKTCESVRLLNVII